MNAPGQTLEQLLSDRVKAKMAEDVAAAKRRDIDAQIAACMANPDKREGSISRTIGRLKATVVYGIKRKANTEALQRNWPTLPVSVRSAFKWNADVQVSGLRQLNAADSRTAADYIESSPATPSVKVEIVALEEAAA